MKTNPHIKMVFIVCFMPFFGLSACSDQPDSEIDLQSHQRANVPALTLQQKERISKFATGWPEAPAYSAGFNVLDPSLSTNANAVSSLFDPADDYWGLPRDDAATFELVDAYCSACHSLSIVMQQHATQQRWVELLVWMEKKQGMFPLPKDEKAAILEYLSEHFSAN